MSYLPAGVPAPDPTIDDQPFWDACAKRELRFQRCAACGKHRHPPAPACPHCRSFAHDWALAPDDAELFSYTVVHYPAHPAVTPALPYNVAIVAYPSLDDVRIVSNVVDVAPEELAIGMRLALVWEAVDEGVLVPRYRRREDARA